MRKKSIKIKNKRYSIHNVPVPADAVDDLIAMGYKKPFKDSIALINFPAQKIILQENLRGKERDSTIFHELLHVTLPNMSERDVLLIEKILFPVLYSHGLRFRK